MKTRKQCKEIFNTRKTTKKNPQTKYKKKRKEN